METGINKINNEKGFTITELLVVIFIISTIIAVSVPSYFGMLRATNMNTATNQIITDIRKAQARSMATGEGYGYQFESGSDNYDYIKDGDPVETLETRGLPEQVTVSSTTFTDNKVTFSRSGAASEGGTITLEYRDGTTRNIAVTRITGRVSLQ